MTPERWKITIDNLRDKFTVEEEDAIHLDEDGGIDIEYVVFKSPVGRIRLEFISKPVVLDKKTTYSRRIGSETKVDYVYSDEERSHTLVAYKWDDEQDDWVEMEAESFV